MILKILNKPGREILNLNDTIELEDIEWQVLKRWILCVHVRSWIDVEFDVYLNYKITFNLKFNFLKSWKVEIDLKINYTEPSLNHSLKVILFTLFMNDESFDFIYWWLKCNLII